MRYVLAIAALVLSGVLLILGIGQRTFLAGPAEISFPVETKSEAGFAVVPAAQLAKVPGQANIVVKGDSGFVAVAETRDIKGWVSPFLHAELSVDVSQERLLSGLVAPHVSDDSVVADVAAPADEAVAAEAPAEPVTGLDPRGSDLWLEERTLDGAHTDTETETLRVPVKLSESQAVLIASDGFEPVPADVTLTWVQDRQTPWAGPLLAAGALVLLIGAVLYLLAIDHDRRGLGPRRGRRGPLLGIRNMFSRRPRGEAAAPVAARPEASDAADVTPDSAADAYESTDRASNGSSGQAETSQSETGGSTQMRSIRRVALPVLGISLALGLSGCSASYWPNFGDTAPVEEAVEAPVSNVAPVPVTDAQLDRIVDRIATVANESDDALDTELLAERFTGDALTQRTANYVIRAALPDYSVVPPRLTSDDLSYDLVQSTVGWPRTILATVASTSGTGDENAASPSLAMVLTQQTPQENYHVSRIVSLRGGISMPQAAPAEEGTALLSNDISSLVLAPGEVGTAFAAVLQGGTEVEEAKLFELTDDTLLANYGKARAEQSQADSDAKEQTLVFSVTAAQGAENPVALSTGIGGALVATTVIEEQIADSAGGRFKPQASGQVTALSGLEGEQERLVQQIAHQLLFYVPSKSDGAKIQLLGVTSELVGVTN